jgi:hypothetical protein
LNELVEGLMDVLEAFDFKREGVEGFWTFFDCFAVRTDR